MSHRRMYFDLGEMTQGDGSMNILCFCISCTPAATMPISNFALAFSLNSFWMSTTASLSPGSLPPVQPAREAAFLVDDCPRYVFLACSASLRFWSSSSIPRSWSPLRVVGAVSRQNYCVDDGIGVTRRGEGRPERGRRRRTPKLRAAYLSLFFLI